MDSYIPLIGFVTLLLTGLGLIVMIARWIAPRPKPPEDEWQKWSKL